MNFSVNFIGHVALCYMIYLMPQLNKCSWIRYLIVCHTRARNVIISNIFSWKYRWKQFSLLKHIFLKKKKKKKTTVEKIWALIINGVDPSGGKKGRQKPLLIGITRCSKVWLLTWYHHKHSLGITTNRERETKSWTTKGKGHVMVSEISECTGRANHWQNPPHFKLHLPPISK